MNGMRRGVGVGTVVMLFALGAGSRCEGGVIELSEAMREYSQDFDTLVTSGSVTWIQDATLPGWYASATGVWDGSLTASTGTSTGGDIYSFGSTGSMERALGSLASGTIAEPFYGLRMRNAGSQAIAELVIEYTGEQWRNNGNTSVQSLLFEYRIGGTAFDNVGWSAGPASLNFDGPIHTSTASTLNGNLAANRSLRSGLLAELALQPGQEFWFRWHDLNDVGSDHALALDDFRVVAAFAEPAPPAISAAEPASIAIWLCSVVGSLAACRLQRFHRRRLAGQLG